MSRKTATGTWYDERQTCIWCSEEEREQMEAITYATRETMSGMVRRLVKEEYEKIQEDEKNE